jgi:magnesium chelatase family protein
MRGSPGAGKSMLARRLTTILPPMSLAEAIDTTRLRRIGELTSGRAAVISTRPFHGGLRYSMPMSTGNRRYGEAG